MTFLMFAPGAHQLDRARNDGTHLICIMMQTGPQALDMHGRLMYKYIFGVYKGTYATSFGSGGLPSISASSILSSSVCVQTLLVSDMPWMHHSRRSNEPLLNFAFFDRCIFVIEKSNTGNFCWIRANRSGMEGAD
jgi:hypothetical protein